MAIDSLNVTGFDTPLLVADPTSGGYPAQLTQVGGISVAAALEIQSVLGAFLLPRLTDPEMDALFPVVDGMMVYNTTNTAVYSHQGGIWAPVGAGGGGSVTSLTQGANIVLTPSPITTVGSIALNPVLTGLTSAVIGNISISTTANTISASSVLNVTSGGNMSLTATAALIQLNSDTQIRSGLTLQIFETTNTFRNSFASTGLTGNVNYIFPTSAPIINGQTLRCTTSGQMSWATDTNGTVTSITAGSNLSATPNPITTTGTISLSNAISGLTSIAVGGFTISGTTIASNSTMTLSSLAAMDLTPTQLRLNSEIQVRSANTLRWFNSGNTFSTSLTAPALAANINYILPLTAPTNGQVLSSLASGVMSWITAGSGSVTSIAGGANITCTPDPIVSTGTIDLDTNLTGLSSVGVGTLNITSNAISATVGSLTLSAAAAIVLNSISEITSSNVIGIQGNSGIKLYNSTNTFSTLLRPGNVSVNTIYTLPSAFPAADGYVLSSTMAGTMSWIAQSGGVTTAKFLLQQADGGLPNAQAMGALATGIVKNTTTTGVQSIAVLGTDYYGPNGPTTIVDTFNASAKNLFVGTGAGGLSTSGGDNIVFGLSCFPNISTGVQNSGLGGRFTGTATTTGSNNCYFGYSVVPNANGSFNVCMGTNSGASMTGTSSGNTYLGYNTASSATSATNCTALGNSVTVASGLTNAMALGASTTISLSNCINIGNGCNVGINVPSPGYALHIGNTGTTSNANVYLANTANAPTQPTGGGVLFVSGGALFYSGTNGTVTLIAPS